MNDQSFKCSFCLRHKHEDCIGIGCVCVTCINRSVICERCVAHKCWECTSGPYCGCIREHHAWERKNGRALLTTSSSGNLEPRNSREPQKTQDCSEADELPQKPAAHGAESDMTPSSGIIGTSEDGPLSPALPASPPPSAARQIPGEREESATGDSFSEARILELEARIAELEEERAVLRAERTQLIAVLHILSKP